MNFGKSLKFCVEQASILNVPSSEKNRYSSLSVLQGSISIRFNSLTIFRSHVEMSEWSANILSLFTEYLSNEFTDCTHSLLCRNFINWSRWNLKEIKNHSERQKAFIKQPRTSNGILFYQNFVYYFHLRGICMQKTLKSEIRFKQKSNKLGQIKELERKVHFPSNPIIKFKLSWKALHQLIRFSHLISILQQTHPDKYQILSTKHLKKVPGKYFLLSISCAWDDCSCILTRRLCLLFICLTALVEGGCRKA